MSGIPRLAGGGAYRSVRYVPTREINASREQTQNRLKELFTPSANPVSQMAETIAERSPIAPNQIARSRGTEQGFDVLNQVMNEQRGLTSKTFVGSPSTVDFIATDLSPLYPGANPTQVKLQTIQGSGYGYANVDGNQPYVSVAAKTPHETAEVLSHELGHLYANHNLQRSNIGYGAQELEAQTASYGIMNRMYPWNKNYLNRSADYGIRAQLYDPDEMDGAPMMAVNPVTYLRNPKTNALLNQVIQTIIPTPRQPFAQIVPAIYS